MTSHITDYTLRDLHREAYLRWLSRAEADRRGAPLPPLEVKQTSAFRGPKKPTTQSVLATI